MILFVGRQDEDSFLNQYFLDSLHPLTLPLSQDALGRDFEYCCPLRFEEARRARTCGIEEKCRVANDIMGNAWSSSLVYLIPN